MVRKRKSEFLSKKELARMLNKVGQEFNWFLTCFVFGLTIGIAFLLTLMYLVNPEKIDYDLIRGSFNVPISTLFGIFIASLVIKSAVKGVFKFKDNIPKLTTVYVIGILISPIFILSSIYLFGGHITTLIVSSFIISFLLLAGLFFIANYRIKTFFEVEVKE